MIRMVIRFVFAAVLSITIGIILLNLILKISSNNEHRCVKDT